MVSETITIRRLSVDDMDAFKRIRLEALEADPASFASSHAQWRDCNDERWRKELFFPVFAAFELSVPVGIMAVRPKWPARVSHRACLTSVYIRKYFRGTGLAFDIFQAVASWAYGSGHRQLDLSVHGDNAPAIRFYEKLGFLTVGRIPEGYWDGAKSADELLMTLRLPH